MIYGKKILNDLCGLMDTFWNIEDYLDTNYMDRLY